LSTQAMSGSDSRQILQDLVHYRTYAGTQHNGRKENRTQVIDRVKEMHQTRFPWYADQIEEAFIEVYKGRTVPSMRTMQFGGMPIFRSNARAYNCAFAALTNWKDFADMFWLLMNGVGTGYSVQAHHVEQLPAITGTWGEVFVVPDSKEGWADGILHLLGNPFVEIQTHLIRRKGAPISSGGTASGPESLTEMYEKVRTVLISALGRKLTPIECFDIMSHIADVVVVGGVRRAATIALFDADDEAMLTSKHGDWWVDNPQRARANISAVLVRSDPDFEAKLRHILSMCFESNCGEPGVSLTNDREYGFNPCHEISLRDGQLCNLSEVNAAACSTSREFYHAVESAAAIGTLQAAYTDFNYLAPKWKENCEKDALIGVSITGQAAAWELLTDEVLHEASERVVETNAKWAELLDINPAARCTTTKPSGSTSAWWGTTSGIHAAHSHWYLRRVRVDRKDAFGQYLIAAYGEGEAESGSFVESDAFAPENIIVTVPVCMEDAIYREHESAIELMERSKHVFDHWIKPGHRNGPNHHNVSLTVSYLPYERKEIIEWMVNNTDSWAGISLLPYDGGSYIQAPFEEISEFEFHQWVKKVPAVVDFGNIDFTDSVDERMGELACAGGACEII